MAPCYRQRTFVTTGQSPTSTGKEYLPTPGGVLTIRDSSGGLDDDATDLLGTPVANLNLASGVLGESLATPYGQNRYTANLSGPGGMQTAKGFTGQYQDTSMAGSSGLDYFNARYYDPAIGRFSSADTAQPGLGDPLGLDTYAYARGMVESATDPSGHSCMAMRSDGEGCDGGGEGFFGYPPNAGEGKSIGGGYDPALQLVLRFLQALKHLHDLMALGRLTDGWGEAADPLIGRSRNGDRFAAEAQAEAQDGIGAAHDPLMRSRDGDQGPGCHCAPRLSSTTGQPSAQPAQVEGSPDVTYHPVNDDPCRDGSTLIRTQCVSWLSRSGGAYKDVLKYGGENHHMPADSVSPFSTGRGPVINMTIEDHRLTASWGSGAAAQAYRDVQAVLIRDGLFRAAQQMDIENVRALFGDKYDAAIQEMLEYMDGLLPEP